MQEIENRNLMKDLKNGAKKLTKRQVTKTRIVIALLLKTTKWESESQEP